MHSYVSLTHQSNPDDRNFKFIWNVLHYKSCTCNVDSFVYSSMCIRRHYLVHASTHVLVSLAHGDLFTQRTSWGDNGNTMSESDSNIAIQHSNCNCLINVSQGEPFFFFLLFLLLRTFSCSSRILSSAIWELSARLNVDMSHAYRNSDRYLNIHKEKDTSLLFNLTLRI